MEINGIKKILTWGLLLTKRLYKKPTFVIILLIIPLLTFIFGMLANEESGFVTVAVAQQGEDEFATEVIEKLTSDTSLIRFVICTSPEEAESKVMSGKADGAWIFPDNMQEHLKKYIETNSPDDAFIRVIEREETVFLKLSREKLTGALFEYMAKENYLQFLRENSSELSTLSDEELLKYYESVETPESLFVFEYSDSDKAVEEATAKGMLVSPLRGLLALVMLIAGLATSMYFVKDKENGLFLLLPQRHLPFIELAYQLLSALNVALAILLSMWLTGILQDLFTELIATLMYALCVSAFCMLFRCIARKLVAISVATPFVAVMCLVVCPVFFNITIIKWAQLMLPPTYYIRADYNPVYLLYAAIYCLALWTVYAVLEGLRKYKL